MNPNYKWVNKGDINYSGCNNTACVLQANGEWVSWNHHTPVKGEMGIYKFDNQGNMDDFGNKANTINRKVFLPSIAEVPTIVNFNDQWEMDSFLRNYKGNRIHMWFRDNRDNNLSNTMYGHCDSRSLNSSFIRSDYVTARPAFVVDLEAYQSAN